MTSPGRPTHPLAGKTVLIRSYRKRLNGLCFTVVCWASNVYGRDWWLAGTEAVHEYARESANGLPLDDNVVYGHLINGDPHLVHDLELGRPIN